jgi:hypothetical protein
MIYKIRVTGEVLETPAATRRCKVEDEILTFGREPIYIEIDELPAKLSTDLYLRIDLVDADCVPAGAPVLTKKRRPRPDEIITLRSERVERDDADIHIHLRSERVENDDTETTLRSERVELQGAKRKNR